MSFSLILDQTPFLKHFVVLLKVAKEVSLPRIYSCNIWQLSKCDFLLFFFFAEPICEIRKLGNSSKEIGAFSQDSRKIVCWACQYCFLFVTCYILCKTLTGFVQSGKIREKMVISKKVRESHGKSWNFVYCQEESRFTGIS